MRKAGKYALIALGIVVVIAVVCIVIANSRYQFLFAGPKVSHETFLTPGTRVRAVFQPPLAKPLVVKIMGASAPPPWIMSRIMPYEVALLAAPDVSSNRIDVKLFLNPQRLAPTVALAADAYSIPKKAPYITWTSPSFDVSKRGVLSLDGYMPMDPDTAAAVETQWGVVQIPSPPSFEGNHLAEISIDNRDGSLFAIISTFANQKLLALPMPLESLRKTISSVATLSLNADIASDDELAIRMVVECQPNAEEGQVTGVSFALGAIYGELVTRAGERGAILSGAKRTDGPTITGNYTLKNVSALLK